MRPEDGEATDLFADELFQRSQTWKLSTSGLGAGYQFRGTGFGAPYQDGYGINCEWVVRALAVFARDLGTSNADGICLCLLFYRNFSDMAAPDLIKFGIESKRSCEETSTEAFIAAITLALYDMRDICGERPNPAQLMTRL